MKQLHAKRKTKAKMRAALGVIGGSGLYEMEGLRAVQKVQVRTPFGPPSDAIMVGILDETKVAFLSRHGRGHLPSEYLCAQVAWRHTGDIGQCGRQHEGIHTPRGRRVSRSVYRSHEA